MYEDRWYNLVLIQKYNLFPLIIFLTITDELNILLPFKTKFSTSLNFLLFKNKLKYFFLYFFDLQFSSYEQENHNLKIFFP